MEWTIGADPEVFVGDKNSVRSIVGRIGGTKEHPYMLPIGLGFAWQEDNVALEYNIPASPSKETFVSNIALAMGFIEATLRDSHGLQFVKESAISFPEEELQTAAAMQFGCEPDYCAWTGKRNPRPKSTDRNLRSCGGHVHIGVDHVLDKRKLIQSCDLFMGVPSVLMDKGELRKQLYGKAGAYRDKKYGAEYRTLSNFWVFSKELTGWVYDNTKQALDATLKQMSFEEDADLIQAAINDNDKDKAMFLVQKYSLQVLQ